MEIKMVEYFDQHFYKVSLGGLKDEIRWIPSVTTKLGIIDKPFLSKWRGDIGNREADIRLFDSQQRGSRIHNAWSIFCLGGVVLYDPWNRRNYTDNELVKIKSESPYWAILNYQDEMLALIKLQKLVEILKPNMLYSERIVYSLTNNDAGTADNIWDIEEGDYKINGSKPLHIPKGRYLLDLKNGNQVSEEAYFQCAAYVKCAEEMGDPEYTGTIILHTSSKNKGGIEGLGVQLSLRDEVEEHYLTYRIASQLWEKKNTNYYPRVFEFPALIKK